MPPTGSLGPHPQSNRFGLTRTLGCDRFWLMMLALSLFPTTYSPPSSHELAAVAPTLLALVERAVSEPEALAAELSESPLAAIAPTFALPDVAPTGPAAAGDLPIVVTHGMGDSCFNPGMQSVVALAGKTLGVEAVCVPTGDNQASDTINGFLMNMDKSVEAFAKRVQSDKRLSGGFDAFGLSQGNNVLPPPPPRPPPQLPEVWSHPQVPSCRSSAATSRRTTTRPSATFCRSAGSTRASPPSRTAPPRRPCSAASARR